MIWELRQKINVNVYIHIFQFCSSFSDLSKLKKPLQVFLLISQKYNFHPNKKPAHSVFKNKQSNDVTRHLCHPRGFPTNCGHQEPQVERTLDPATHQVAEW